MTTIRDISLTILAGITIIGVVIIVVTGKTVPSDLWSISLVLVGAVAGVAVPGAITNAITAGKVNPGANASVQ